MRNSIVQNKPSATQYLSDYSKEADNMRNDYYRYMFLPFVDDLIEQYAVNEHIIDIKFIPLADIIELSGMYYKCKGHVSATILNEVLQDRAAEKHLAKYEGLKRRVDAINGEISYSR